VLTIDPILTVAEVARELRCSRAQAYKLLRGEVPGVTQLPSIQIGRRRVVRRSALERWKRSNEVGAPEHGMLAAPLEGPSG
jgi:excisionase family DNA binding protein